jgi:AcrR family transcriptional regulator
MLRRPPGRPAGGSHVADRGAVLDAAERAIARDGHGVSLEAIAAEAGVTKPIVYARIGSRADLSDALAERLGDRLLAAVNAPAATGAPPGRDTLVAVFRTVVETIGAHRELFLYVTRGTANDTPERALFVASRSAAPLAQWIAQTLASDGRDPALAEAWAYAIIGMLNLVTLWWMQETELPAKDIASQLADLVWPGLSGSDRHHPA